MHAPVLEELVDGPDLEKYMIKRQDARLSRNTVFGWSSDLLNALSFLHDRDPIIIHRCCVCMRPRVEDLSWTLQSFFLLCSVSSGRLLPLFLRVDLSTCLRSCLSTVAAVGFAV